MSISTNPRYCLKCDAPYASLPDQWGNVPTCQCVNPDEPAKLTLSPGMFDTLLGRASSGFIGLVLLAIVLMLNGCTYVKTDSLAVIDFHPVGGTTDIDASKTADSMTLKANRNQGSSEGIVRAPLHSNHGY